MKRSAKDKSETNLSKVEYRQTNAIGMALCICVRECLRVLSRYLVPIAIFLPFYQINWILDITALVLNGYRNIVASKTLLLHKGLGGMASCAQAKHCFI